jgi:hypothetical protein
MWVNVGIVRGNNAVVKKFNFNSQILEKFMLVFSRECTIAT